MRRKLLMSTAGFALAIGVIGAITATSYPAIAQQDGGIQAPVGGDTLLLPDEGDKAAAPAIGSTEPSSAMNGDLFIARQEANQLRVDDLVGHNVVNASDESIGDVNDIIIGPDGSVDGLIVGVGGFLGIGEKNVGVRFDAFDIRHDPETTQISLELDMTRDQLDATQPFVTREAQIAAARLESDMQDTGFGVDKGITSATQPPAAPAMEQ